MRLIRARALTLGLGALLAVAGTGTQLMRPAGEVAVDASGHGVPCSSADTGGGDWPSYGHDAFSTRNQPAETSIGPAKARTLAPRFVFKLSALGDSGNLNSTPVAADGCVFVASTSGNVYAVRAGNGHLMWQASFPVAVPGLGGGIVGGAAVDSGRVILLINESGDGGSVGPYAVALDEHTGALVWKSAPLSTESGFYTNATPQVFDGLVFAGFSPPEGANGTQGGFVLLDAATGATLKTTTTISPADQAQGFAGGGIWSTPAYDAATGYAYVGAGNPYSKTKEDVRTNSILKIDLARTRPTFGEIVASYKGQIDQYTDTLEALSQTPVCSASADSGLPFPLDDPFCGQLDLDFGASPNLFVSGGRLLVGDLQKSGVYHVADAATMAPVWSTLVGLSCASCNAASTAASGGAVFGVGTPGGVAFSLSQADGSRRWLQPIADGAHYQSTSTANGVVYTLDGDGFLDVFNAAGGGLLIRRPLSTDAGAPVFGLTSGGVAIAYHTVYVAASEGGAGPASTGFLIAYRPAVNLP